MASSARGPVVVRRATAAPRDTRAVTELLRAAGDPPGDTLAAALADDRWGIVLLAEHRGETLGVTVLRLWGPPGAPSRRALIDTLWVRPDRRRQGIASALVQAASVEAEARGATDVRLVAPSGDPAAVALTASLGYTAVPAWSLYARAPSDTAPMELSIPVEVPVEARAIVRPPGAHQDVPQDVPQGVHGEPAGEHFELAPGAVVVLDPAAEVSPAVSFWSGALAFRTRWAADRRTATWTTEGCLGSRDEGGDVLRFDPGTRRVRETWLSRPSSVRIDARLLAAVEAAPCVPGVPTLHPDATDFACPPMAAALFDVALGCYAAVTAPLAHGGIAALGSPGELRAAAITAHVHLLFAGGRCVGWRVLDPVTHARPMGWPEPREGAVPAGPRRTELTALLYDWMTLDASARVRPDEAADPDEIAHLVAVRDRARRLAALTAPDDDPVPGVARDIAAHVHWSWGFFRLGD